MIIDTLYAAPKQLTSLAKKYPNCQLQEQHLPAGLKQYLVMIPDECEESYFNFLIDNMLAISSRAFLRRLDADPEFGRKVRSRMSHILEEALRRNKSSSSAS